MADIGFNDNLAVSGRTFHFQTASNMSRGNVNCEIFENGRLLNRTVVDFERRKDNKSHSIENRLKTIVESLHQEMMAEVELLFLISEKVKKLRHSPSNCKMGIMFLQNNLVDDAIRQFELAIKNDPENVEAYIYLGRVLLDQGQTAKAVKLLKQAIEKNAGFADLHNQFGVALLQENDFKQALAQFQNALKLNKDYLEVQYNLALLYFKSTFFDKTDEFLPPPSIRIQRGIERIEKINSNKPELLNSNYPKIQKFLEKENYEALVKFLEESRSKIFIQDAVNLIGTSFYLKFMYGGKGLDNEIIKKYESKLEAALEIFPDYADIWNNLGIIHLIQCRNLFLQALSEFKRSLEINPGFDKARKNKKLVENDGKEFLILLRAILK